MQTTKTGLTVKKRGEILEKALNNYLEKRRKTKLKPLRKVVILESAQMRSLTFLTILIRIFRLTRRLLTLKGPLLSSNVYGIVKFFPFVCVMMDQFNR